MKRVPRDPYPAYCAGEHPGFPLGRVDLLLPGRGRARERLDRVGAAGAVERPRRALRPGVRAPFPVAGRLRPSTDHRSQCLSILDRAQRRGTGARCLLRRGSPARARTRGRAGPSGRRAGRDAPPFHPSRLVSGRGGMGESRVRRRVSPIRGGRGGRPGIARAHLDHLQRADRPVARRLRRRRHAAGTEELPARVQGLRAHAPCPRRGGRRARDSGPRKPGRHRPQHAGVRSGSGGQLSSTGAWRNTENACTTSPSSRP